jgi:hypothetical protein
MIVLLSFFLPGQRCELVVLIRVPLSGHLFPGQNRIIPRQLLVPTGIHAFLALLVVVVAEVTMRR